MRITRLEIGNLRGLRQAQLTPGAALNLLTGGNGAGKTSVLEALHLMAYGRSFRGRVHEGLIRSGATALEIFVEWHQPGAGDGAGTHHRAGLRHTGQAWEGRLDGADVGHLGELCAALAVVTVEPGSHSLITGNAEGRRRYLDWGLFHVEPAFLPLWRRYARALKQRNALLKRGQRDPQLDVWERELATSGEPVTHLRQRYLEQLQPQLVAVLGALFPTAGSGQLLFQPGWRRDDMGLADALLLSRDRDLALGHTSLGPHRADWSVDLASIPGRSALSRGQAKLTALCALLAQAEHHARLCGDWPVVALDDLASELDRAHQLGVLDRVLASGAQVFLTGTEPPAVLAEFPHCPTRFHVEHGTLVPEAMA